VVDGSGEVGDTAKTEGAVAHQFDLVVVHTFQGAVGDAECGPGKQPSQVIAEHTDEALAGLQSGSHCRVHALLEMALGAARLLVIPEELEGFLQVSRRISLRRISSTARFR